MGEYYINNITIKGFVFYSNEPLDLNGVVELARELRSRGYLFHINEKINNRYECISLSRLERLLEDNSSSLKSRNKN